MNSLSYDWLETRHNAEQITCRHCGAQPDQTCRNPQDGHVLEFLPAHASRIKDS